MAGLDPARPAATNNVFRLTRVGYSVLGIRMFAVMFGGAWRGA